MIHVLVAFLLAPGILLRTAFRRKTVPERILVVQTAKIGDWVCSTSVFRAIRKAYPSARIVAMVSPAAAPLAACDPNADETMTVRAEETRGFAGKRRLARRIRDGRFDVAVCLNPATTFAVALFRGLVPLRACVLPDFLGITFRLASLLFSRVEPHVRGRMVVETYAGLLERIGVRGADLTRTVGSRPGAAEAAAAVLGGAPAGARLVGIAVSSGNRMKELSDDRIVALCDRLAEDPSVRLVLVGATADRAKADAILARAAARDRIVDAVGALALDELPALLSRLSLFVGVDTGTLYMADALSVPVIDIAGPADMEDQRPIGPRAVVVRSDAPCAPCSHAFRAPYACCRPTRDCVESFSPEEVLRAARRLLSGSAGGGA